MSATVRAEAPVSADYIGLRLPALPSDLGVPVATWSPRDLTCFVIDGSVTSVWSASVSWFDGRPGGHVGYELTDISCESVTPEGEPSEGARESAWEMLDSRADEIGEAR
jgi:hypothetical protein